MDNLKDLTLPEIRKACEARVSEEALNYPEPAAEKGKIDSMFVRQCLDCQDLGEGLLFAHLNKGQFIFNASSGDWLKWAGHYWERDEKKEVLSAIETTIIPVYLDELNRISEQIAWAIQKKDTSQHEQLESLRKKIMKRIDRLRTQKGREACLEFSITCGPPSLIITGDTIDRDPWALGVPNGKIDLRSGKLIPGDPEDFITKPCSVPYWKDAGCPAFEEFLIEILNNDKELVQFMQRILGYSLIGTVIEHIIILFFGMGRNGKSTLIEILKFILGPLCRPIPSEMLLFQKFQKGSAGPSPDIMMLQGLRVAFASETDEGNRFSMNTIKQLSGGDSLTARNPHDKHPVTFEPSHTLFLLTNWRPQASADDNGFWERIIEIDFPNAYVDRAITAKNERPAKKNLIHDLKKEASGILAWLVRGCINYQNQGLNPPKSVREAASNYRRQEDLLGEFLADNCNIGEHFKEQSKGLYDKFSSWFKDTISEKNIPSQKRFSNLMARRFGSAVPGEKGCRYFYGVELKVFLGS